MRISQLSLKQIDNDEHMRANGKARAEIELRVYVLKGQTAVSVKAEKYGHAIERTLTHTYTFWLL